MKSIYAVVILAACAYAQPKIDSPVATGNVNFTGATTTRTVKTGTSDPATCTVGELLFRTDATAGQNLKACTSTNTWTMIGGGGSSPYAPEVICAAHPSDVVTETSEHVQTSCTIPALTVGSVVEISWTTIHTGGNTGNSGKVMLDGVEIAAEATAENDTQRIILYVEVLTGGGARVWGYKQINGGAPTTMTITQWPSGIDMTDGGAVQFRQWYGSSPGGGENLYNYSHRVMTTPGR